MGKDTTYAFEVMTGFQAVRKPRKARCADRHLDIIERDCEQKEQL